MSIDTSTRPSETPPASRPPSRRSIVIRVVALVIAFVLIVAYLRLMLDVTARPVVPYQVPTPTAVPTATPAPTPTILERSAPRGSLDFPADGSTVTAQTQVRGWAVDAASQTGSGVDRVSLYLDGTYLQDAEYGHDRQDIGGVFGTGFTNSGWATDVDLSQQSQGAHTLEARVHSSFSDQDTSYTAHVVIAPPSSTPRGAIDFPTANDVVSGATEVRGWAIDETARDGTGVDRVDVYVDGALQTQAAMGQNRPDIAAGYGQPFEGAGWRAEIDLSEVQPGSHQLEARVHTILDDRVTTYSTTIDVSE